MKPERVQNRLAKVPDWQEVALDRIVIEWKQTFSSFNQVIEILVEIALLVEEFDRVPDISVQGNGLTVHLGMNGFEEADFDLAEAICRTC